MPSKHYTTAIVGAGFCGALTAANLSRLSPNLSIALIDPNEAAKGLAYGTTDPDHLLNVRANQMGAFADDPGHFWRWLEKHPVNATQSAQDFMPRIIYGRYLTEILESAQAANPNLQTLRRRITTMHRQPDGAFELVADDNQAITAANVVLALGNFPPSQHSRDQGAMNPYRPETWQQLADDGDILIVGTGLTSMDLIVTLAKTKSSGTIHLLSRHGLLPREHTTPSPHILKLGTSHPTTALALLQLLRKEIATHPDIAWQSIIDALRPLNQTFWQSLNLAEQRRFMRHLRSYWDVHRHRCAPEIMDAYRNLEKQNRLKLHHGSIISQTAQGKNWKITYRPRGQTTTETFAVRHITRCTGPQSDFAKLDDALVQNLLHQGLLAPDPLHMGVTTQTYNVRDAGGRAFPNLYTLGSLLKGQLYESIAVPELRVQAADVAKHIAQETARA